MPKVKTYNTVYRLYMNLVNKFVLIDCFYLCQLAEKEITLSELETSAHEMHKEHYTALNMEDRLRHFEAQSTLVDTLQRELTSTQVRQRNKLIVFLLQNCCVTQDIVILYNISVILGYY